MDMNDINGMSENKLEFGKIRERLMALTSFAGGRALAEKIAPQHKLDTVRQRLEETREAMELLRFGQPSFLQKIKPLDTALRKTESGGVLLSEELARLFHFLVACRLAAAYTANRPTPLIHQLLERVHVDRGLEASISQVVDEEGNLRDDASPGLKDIRRQITVTQQRIKDYLQDLLRSAKYQPYLQDAIITERSGRYVVPVKQENRHDLPGIVHDESSSGATVFIEPMAVVQNQNKIRGLEQEERREIERVLRQATQLITPVVDDIKRSVSALSAFDLIIARGRLAYEMNAYQPTVNDEGVLELFKARHPLLGQEVVPIDVTLGKDFDILVITGPNTGGKTVVLKTIGLLTMMAMCGLYIPAREGSRISLFNKIFVDIGDEQSIEQSLSTFSAHMTHLVAILKKADRRSLVLLDELGSGTDPAEGAALGQAILERFQQLQVRAVVTTHQSALKNFAYQCEAVENACVEFDPVTLKPTYRLTVGRPGQSNALAISGHLGLDPAITARARTLLPEQELEMGAILHALSEQQDEYDRKIKQLEQQFTALRAGETALEEAKAALEEERVHILGQSRQEAMDYLHHIRREADEAVAQLKRRIHANEKTPPKFHELNESRQKLKALTVEPYHRVNGVASGRLQIGDQVEIIDLQQRGEVLTTPGAAGEVLVQVGSMRLSVHKDRLALLKKTKRAEKDLPSRVVSIDYLDKISHISPTIDLRGELSDEALYRLDKYINEATLAGLEQIHIIHGKGTGALRAAVRAYLKRLDYVRDFRDGLNEEGGAGVTVAYFK